MSPPEEKKPEQCDEIKNPGKKNWGQHLVDMLNEMERARRAKELLYRLCRENSEAVSDETIKILQELIKEDPKHLQYYEVLIGVINQYDATRRVLKKLKESRELFPNEKELHEIIEKGYRKMWDLFDMCNKGEVSEEVASQFSLGFSTLLKYIEVDYMTETSVDMNTKDDFEKMKDHLNKYHDWIIKRMSDLINVDLSKEDGLNKLTSILSEIADEYYTKLIEQTNRISDKKQ